MEEALDQILQWLDWFAGQRWLLVLVSFVLGALIFGRGYKKRIAALEARASIPNVTQTFNYNFSSNAGEHNRRLRAAIDGKTSQSLTKTLRNLPQTPLGDGHTYARLPDGTNIVSMADGSFRLAIPIHLSATFSGGLDGNLSASVEKDPPDEGGGQ